MTIIGDRNTYVWMDKSEIINPRGPFVEVLRDRWWIVNDQGQVCFYRGHFPQCNADRRISEKILEKHATPGGVGVEFIPLAFRDIDVRDYAS